MACRGGAQEEEAGGDRVVQITKEDGTFYYGAIRCGDADDAYRRFRDEHNKSVGKCAFKRLNRLGSRVERIHGYGIVFKEQAGNPGFDYKQIPVRLMGLVCGSYGRMLGRWNIPGEVDDDNFDGWFEWVFGKGSGCLRLERTKEKVGRTSRRLNKHFR